MELETKVLSRELQQRMYDNGLPSQLPKVALAEGWHKPLLPRRAHLNILKVA